MGECDASSNLLDKKNKILSELRRFKWSHRESAEAKRPLPHPPRRRRRRKSQTPRLKLAVEEDVRPYPVERSSIKIDILNQTKHFPP